MTSSDAKPTNFSRRFLWLAAFIVLLFGGYTVGWFYVADRLTAQASAAIAGLNRDGVRAECGNLTVRGFPFRLGIFCDSLGYEDEARAIFAAAGSFRSAAQVYQPAKTVGELDGPLRVAVPGLLPLWIDWDKLRWSTRIARPLPERISVEAEGVSGMTDPEDADPIPLFSATKAATHFRPNGADLDWALSFEELAVDPAVAGGRVLPVMNGAGDVGLKDGIQMLLTGQESLRGRSVEIRSLDLSSGEGGVVVSGPVSVAADGLIDARLMIKLRNPPAVAAVLSGVFPEAKRQIDSSFAGLALLGSEPALPLVVTKGRAMLGFIPLGEIPPVE
ncbi:DUF2125 domain-containing protein [Mesorhizobium sp. 1B3]|uniref:DUF2125 domain-containing protein n=1 Tax=Mesorhizobium sp. 1B3 TaxID=3243599 RepID=UPI003D98EB91